MSSAKMAAILFGGDELIPWLPLYIDTWSAATILTMFFWNRLVSVFQELMIFGTNECILHHQYHQQYVGLHTQCHPERIGGIWVHDFIEDCFIYWRKQFTWEDYTCQQCPSNAFNLLNAMLCTNDMRSFCWGNNRSVVLQCTYAVSTHYHMLWGVGCM